MAGRLRNLVPGLVLTLLLLAASGGLYEFALSVTSPLAAATPWEASKPSPAFLDVLPEPPAPFEPNAITGQPVFAVSRKPPPPPLLTSESPLPEVVAEPASPETSHVAPPDYILAGILISSTSQRVLLKKHKSEKGSWLSRGQMTSDGWTVLTVKPAEATIRRSPHQFTLQFRSLTQVAAQK